LAAIPWRILLRAYWLGTSRVIVLVRPQLVANYSKIAVKQGISYLQHLL
jgi:hypothetical protein